MSADREGEPNAALGIASAQVPPARVAVSFDDTYCANIAATPNYTSASGGATGFQYVGTTLYASVFKATSKTAIARTRIADDGSWIYTWYACDSQSQKSLSEDDAIPGATGPSFTIGDDQVGKYLFVKVTAADGTTASGPRLAGKPSGNLRGVGQVKAAVPIKTALDNKSYILLQPKADATSTGDTVKASTLKVGDVLWANAFDSEASPNVRIAAQERWSYQWLASTDQNARDDEFIAIEGQTGPSLAITDELACKLAGSYIRVRVSGDDQTLYGPSGTFNTPASTSYNTPGPVVAPGQIKLDHIILSWNGEGFSDDYENTPDCNVGDTLEARAYDSDDLYTLFDGGTVDFSWQVADSPQGEFREVATGDTFTVGAYAHKYLKVVATAKTGVPRHDRCETEAGKVLPAGASTLYRVEILNGSASKETGTTLKAQAYKGDYWSSAPVTENVTYTWRWCETKPSYSTSEDEWHVVRGVTGPDFTVPSWLDGCWVSVSACAGDNTVALTNSSAAGPFQKPSVEEPVEGEKVTVAARVTGVTPHRLGEEFQAVDWVPLSEGLYGEQLTAWDIFATLLDKAGYFYDLNGGCPYSVTTPDGSQTLAMSANAPWSYWMFLVNGEYASSLPSGYHPQEGDLIELVYLDATGVATTPDIAVEPDAPVAEWESPWASFGAGVHEGVSVDGALESLEGSWSYDFAQGGYASWSEPVVAGGFVFFATNDKLLKLDAATGVVVAEAQLAGTTAYGCRPVYADGLVVVPLNGGRIQALSALTLQTKWLTATLPALEQAVEGAVDPVAYEQQALSTMTVSDGYLYAFTAAADWSQTYGGWGLCINLANGAVRWSAVNESAGYYWAGAAEIDGYLIVAGDDGTLAAVSADSTDGAVVSTLDLGAAARSSVVVSDGAAYVVTTDGVLHQVVVGEGGALAEAHRVKFADSSTSTAAVVDGTVYVGGQIGGAGVLAAIDTTTWGAPVVVSQADGAALPGDVKSTPLVVRDHRGCLVLFTCNGAVGNWPAYTGGGGVYGWRPGSAEATLLFDPPAGQHNYSMASVAFDGSRFYYVNDAGILFALSASDKTPATPAPTPNPDENEGPENNGAANQPVGPSNDSAGSGSRPSSNGDSAQKAATGTASTQRGPLVPSVQLTAKASPNTRVIMEQNSGTAAGASEAEAAPKAASASSRTAISDDAAPLAADAGSPERAATGAVDQLSTQEPLAWALLLAALTCAAGAAYLIVTARKRREEEGTRGA
ncbi:PQQ-binding-like beta-propeller repeat protein [uncultured Adlercreutzia sp.]|uniref:PQQ-binding-like beta-propeller repeat protein n=1 Tax=uncultured Adlercreutzia sp. TaxID=875803 RepID=UPI0025D05D0D|nr:PQQ-binding-like beta-propeller repeat protein [uncultured Adlercreutzia sp.]